MIEICLTALITGLSTGFYCLNHCLPVYLTFLFSEANASRTDNIKKLMFFLSGRFTAYILVGLLAGFAGSYLTIMPLVRIFLAFGYVILGAVIFTGIFKKSSCSDKKSCIRNRTGIALGFFTGISLCPPMLLAITYVMEHGNILKGLSYFVMFFVGTSLYFLPFTFLKSTAVVSRLCRFAALIVAITFIALGLSNIYAYSYNYYNIYLKQEHKSKIAKESQESLKSNYQETTADRLAQIKKTKTRNKSIKKKIENEAMYFNKLSDGKVQCTLCPHFCVLKDGQTGICKVRTNINQDLHTLVMGKVVAAHTDPIEKKPLYHFLPDTDAFSIATAGCNLSCKFCQNWEISQKSPQEIRGYEMSPDDIVKTAISEGAKSIAYTYTEPTVFYEYMLATAKLAKENGIKNIWVTAGYINPEPLENLCKYIDAANVDLKSFNNDFYEKYSGAKLEPVLNTLKTLHKNNVWLEITNLVIPDLNDSPEEIKAMCEWIVQNLGTDYPLHFSRFFPKYKMQEKPPTPVETLIMARDIAKECGLKHVYIGNVILEGTDNTYCPSCGTEVITREGYLITSNIISDGKCGKCGEKISGVWDAE